MDQEFPKAHHPIGAPRLRVVGVSRGDKVRDVSFEVRAGEVLGITGLVGAGRTELARLIAGADPMDAGTILVDGQPVDVTDPRAAIRAGIRGALAVSEDALMDPEVMLGALNRLIAASRGRQVVPCNYVAIDLSTGRLIYANAGGMPPLLMVAPGRLVTLDQSTRVLGVDPDYSYGVTRAELPEKFRLVMHSDGLSEATNGSGEALGDQRLHEVLLKQETFATPNDVILQIDAAWQNHLAGAEPDDDATVLVIGRE